MLHPVVLITLRQILSTNLNSLQSNLMSKQLNFTPRKLFWFETFSLTKTSFYILQCWVPIKHVLRYFKAHKSLPLNKFVINPCAFRVVLLLSLFTCSLYLFYVFCYFYIFIFLHYLINFMYSLFKFYVYLLIIYSYLFLLLIFDLII